MQSGLKNYLTLFQVTTSIQDNTQKCRNLFFQLINAWFFNRDFKPDIYFVTKYLKNFVLKRAVSRLVFPNECQLSKRSCCLLSASSLFYSLTLPPSDNFTNGQPVSAKWAIFCHQNHITRHASISTVHHTPLPGIDPLTSPTSFTSRPITDVYIRGVENMAYKNFRITHKKILFLDLFGS